MEQRNGSHEETWQLILQNPCTYTGLMPKVFSLLFSLADQGGWGTGGNCDSYPSNFISIKYGVIT